MGETDTQHRVTLGRSIILWITSAIIGWVVIIMGVYYLVRTGDTLIAEMFSSPAEQSRSELMISDSDIEALKKIAPAAGSSD